jgi:hypothetical protein
MFNVGMSCLFWEKGHIWYGGRQVFIPHYSKSDRFNAARFFAIDISQHLRDHPPLKTSEQFLFGEDIWVGV